MQVGHAVMKRSVTTAIEGAAQGLFRSVAAESPMISMRAVALGGSLPTGGTSTDGRKHEMVVQVQRLLQSASATMGAPVRAPRREGLYVLSGGLGSLGLLVASWLTSYEEAPLWLLGRT